MLVLGCIEANFCKKICVQSLGKFSPRSTQRTPVHRSQSSNFSQKSLKILPKCLQDVCQILLNFIKLFLQASKSTGIKKRSIENSFEVEDVAHGFHFSRHDHQPKFVKSSLDFGQILPEFWPEFAQVCDLMSEMKLSN